MTLDRWGLQNEKFSGILPDEFAMAEKAESLCALFQPSQTRLAICQKTSHFGAPNDPKSSKVTQTNHVGGSKMRSFLAYCQTSLRWLKKLSRCVPAQQVVGHDAVHVLPSNCKRGVKPLGQPAQQR
jgi:hypothetical protein